MKLCFSIATFLLLFIASPVESQQPLVGIIQGTVKNPEKTPIPYASLTATNIDSDDPEDGRRTTETDRRGLYQFVDVPAGRYSIVVKMKGYIDYTIDLVTVYPGGTVNIPEIKMSVSKPKQK
jgi:hypothetical protein